MSFSCPLPDKFRKGSQLGTATKANLKELFLGGHLRRTSERLFLVNSVVPLPETPHKVKMQKNSVYIRTKRQRTNTADRDPAQQVWCLSCSGSFWFNSKPSSFCETICIKPHLGLHNMKSVLTLKHTEEQFICEPSCWSKVARWSGAMVEKLQILGFCLKMMNKYVTYRSPDLNIIL